MSLYSCFKIYGDDAASFLQGQLSTDINQLTDHPQPTVYCSPKGLVLGFMFILSYQDGFVILTNDPQPDQFLQRLKMFVLRSKVLFAPLTWQVTINTSLPVQPLFEFSFNGLGYQVYEAPPNTIQDNSALDGQSLEFLETLNLVPQIGPQNRNQILAPFYNFDLVQAISYTKGCFVGQEPIARLFHRSKASKRTAVYRLDSTEKLSWSTTDPLQLTDETGRSVRTQIVRQAHLVEATTCRYVFQLLVNVRQLAHPFLYLSNSDLTFAQQASPYPLDLDS